mmetsp:Transcript_5811/g.10888  ORF Transcript_5811/g.10888 Transcript_5811/m.10888 type:complete len:212 (+) Transcript_5811:225-860(+)
MIVCIMETKKTKKGEHGALFNAFAIRFDKPKANGELNFEFVPVEAFEDRGPALPLRLCRQFYCQDATQNFPEWTNVYDINTGRFVVRPFRYEAIDKQTIGLLLAAASRDGREFMSMYCKHSPRQTVLEREVSDTCLALKHIYNYHSSEEVFKNGAIYFSTASVDTLTTNARWEAVDASFSCFEQEPESLNLSEHPHFCLMSERLHRTTSEK